MFAVTVKLDVPFGQGAELVPSPGPERPAGPHRLAVLLAAAMAIADVKLLTTRGVRLCEDVPMPSWP
jgi:hypothetical protein